MPNIRPINEEEYNISKYNIKNNLNPNIRNGGRPYGQRIIKLHTKQRTFLAEI